MKKLVVVTLLIFFVFYIQNLVRSVYSLWQKQGLLVSARNELEQEKTENRTLKEQAQAIKQPAYIEQQARDKLLLLKPGEQYVIVSDKLIVVRNPDNNQVDTEKPNWQQWWELFF